MICLKKSRVLGNAYSISALCLQPPVKKCPEILCRIFNLLRSSHEGRRKTSEKLSRTWQRYCCPFWHHKCCDSSLEADFPHFWGVHYRKALLQQHPDDVNFAQHGTFKANRLEAAPGMEKTITKCTSLNRVRSAASVRRPSHGQCH